jgi:hypothetical protein
MSGLSIHTLPGPLPQPATTLTEHVAEIHRLRKRGTRDVIKIGGHLIACQKIVGHGNFLPWVECEFGWSEDTAERFIRLYKLSCQIPQIAEYDIAPSGLYLLAAPSTPKTVLQQVIERAEAGEKFTHAQIKTMIAEAKAVPKAPRAEKVIKRCCFCWATGEDVAQLFTTGLDPHAIICDVCVARCVAGAPKMVARALQNASRWLPVSEDKFSDRDRILADLHASLCVLAEIIEPAPTAEPPPPAESAPTAEPAPASDDADPLDIPSTCAALALVEGKA